jgi:hypothetical protein
VSALWERQAGKLSRQLRARTGEDTLLVYAASRVGSWAALARTELFGAIESATDSPLSAWARAPNAKIERLGAKGTSLPTSFYIFVTAQNLHFHKIRGIMLWTSLGRELGVLSRRDLQATAVDKKVTRRFALFDRDLGQAVAFEAYRRHHLTDEFTELIGARIVGSPEGLAQG